MFRVRRLRKSRYLAWRRSTASGERGFHAQAEQAFHEQPQQVRCHVQHGTSVGPPSTETSEEIHDDTGRNGDKKREQPEENAVLVRQAEERGGKTHPLESHMGHVFVDDSYP